MYARVYTVLHTERKWTQADAELDWCLYLRFDNLVVYAIVIAWIN